MGFNQKQSVAILYVLSVILGLSAVLLTTSGEVKIIILVVAVLLSVMIRLSIKAYDRQQEKKQPEQFDKEGIGRAQV